MKKIYGGEAMMQKEWKEIENYHRMKKQTSQSKSSKYQEMEQFTFYMPLVLKKTPLSLNIGCDRVDKIVGLPKKQNKTKKTGFLLESVKQPMVGI